jgi:hypothetical protein
MTRGAFRDRPNTGACGHGQGDPLAMKWHAILNSAGYRKGEALMAAAHAAHPLFESFDRGWTWKGEGDGPSPDAVLDWFQLNHPTQAREIERRFEQDL